ncbi:MAG: hypothetical protein F4Z01_07665 [Gammaproteobacteria bacterium]|nr:hypothetical protein [Gammaproteobacteria bacterium]MYF37935.1 hypothetical protein [Gammaproteobacteria bacterium]
MTEARNEKHNMIEQLLVDSNLTLVRRVIGVQILVSIGLILLLKTGFSVSWTWCGLISGIFLVVIFLQVIYYQRKKNAIAAKVRNLHTSSTTKTKD